MTPTYEKFLTNLSKPARSALLYATIDSFQKLASYTEKEILALHGGGSKSLPVIYEALSNEQLQLKDATNT